MNKQRTRYLCQNCGTSSLKWLGRCLGCGEWNTLVEETVTASKTSATGVVTSEKVSFQAMDDATAETLKQRLSTGINELDRVLGGGLVSDSLTLLGGDPGVGKSTLLLQLARGLTEESKTRRICYVSGEESIDQIRSRALRLGLQADSRVLLAAETQLEKVLNAVRAEKPDVLVMDSLQTFSSEVVESAPGSVSQVREIAHQLMKISKGEGVAVILVGHVTKDGTLAGPKVVEHMVDTVLHFEGDSGLNYRILRAVKNRFGSAREIGVFEMQGAGLVEVANPSSLFLSERTEDQPGTAVTACVEGTRPILVELQALTTSTTLSMPRRTSVGLDSNRVALLAAILERHLEINLSQFDLFFNVAGGFRLQEPASDLAAATAIWSSAMGRAIPRGTILIGELGLTGEVRSVSIPEVRVEEARKLGFQTAIVPKSVMSRLNDTGIQLIPVSKISEIPAAF